METPELIDLNYVHTFTLSATREGIKYRQLNKQQSTQQSFIQ